MIKHEVIDRETGEISPALVLSRKRVKWRFAMVNLVSYDALTMDENIKLTHWRVLGWLISHSTSSGLVRVTQADLAKTLSLSEVSVNGAIKYLCDAKYIRRDGVGRYILSSSHFSRGGRSVDGVDD